MNIQCCLKESTGNKAELFGGFSIILSGDPAQPNPVGGSPLYYNEPSNLLSTQGYFCYLKLDKAICLEKTVRQQNLNNDPDQDKFKAAPSNPRRQIKPNIGLNTKMRLDYCLIMPRATVTIT
ncbi:ATP-dependent DNA helicase PIF1 [Brachionus plicatilis]|uniref:ATP-dependent DNA helicase PIF1 n=1 Tax=Brachionus plicatilis TaxID=10195 RepID=A0A3M7Q8K8_BRAPC|nr:ATP-dependent DNA helicase PIF1 [Brachionus plicatilis]